MAPLYLETGLLGIVGHALVAVLGVLVTEEETAVIAVSLAVVACSREAPGAFGIDFAQQFQVPLVVDGKIIATIAQVETAGTLVAITGHDETAGIALGEGKETIGYGQRQRHIGHHQIGGSKNHILARTHLGTRKGNIEIGVWGITGGVESVLEIQHA